MKMRNDAELAEARRVRDYVAEGDFNKTLSTFAGRAPERAEKRLEAALRDLRAGRLPREYPDAEMERALRE